MAVVRGGRRRRQRRVPSGGLHAAQPQGERAAAGPCLQRPRHHRQPGLGAGAGHAGAAGHRLLLARRAGRRRRAGLVVLLVLWLQRAPARRCRAPRRRQPAAAAAADGSFDFLRIPAVWMCFAFFFFYAVRAERGPGLRAGGGAAAARRAGRPGRGLPDDLHGVQRRRHGAGRLPGLRPGALRARRRRRLRPGRAGGAGDRLRARAGAGRAGAVRRHGLRQRHRRALARPAGQALDAGERHAAGSTASSIRASTSARRWRRWCSAR